MINIIGIKKSVRFRAKNRCMISYINQTKFCFTDYEVQNHKEYYFYILLSYFQYTNDWYLVVVDLVMKVEQFSI